MMFLELYSICTKRLQLLIDLLACSVIYESRSIGHSNTCSFLPFAFVLNENLLSDPAASPILFEGYSARTVYRHYYCNLRGCVRVSHPLLNMYPVFLETAGSPIVLLKYSQCTQSERRY